MATEGIFSCVCMCRGVGELIRVGVYLLVETVLRRASNKAMAWGIFY